MVRSTVPPLSSEPASPLLVDERAHVLHSHHYNAALARALLETERVDARSILESAAAELAFESLRERGEGPALLSEAVELFRQSGLGRLDVSGMGADGGEAVVEGSHFADAWVRRFGRAKMTVCAMPTGFLAGSLAAAFGLRFEVEELTCVARGDDLCRFRAAATREPPPPLPEPARVRPASIARALPSGAAIEEEVVVAALMDGTPSADREGRILALGGSLTRVWGDFYNRVSFRFEREVPRVLGAKFGNLPALVLTEAAHSYAFHTLGGILCSDEWHQRVVPLLRSRADWFHAAIALVNALGWGTWRVQALVPHQRATVRVFEGYEAAGYRRLFGNAGAPHCYLARGTVAALMNLLYLGDIASRPALTPSYYNQLFRSPLSFRAVETRCHAMDDPYCEFIANPLSPGLSERLRELSSR